MLLDVAWGQCVMCKAVAEDSAEDGSLGRGLNAASCTSWVCLMPSWRFLHGLCSNEEATHLQGI